MGTCRTAFLKLVLNDRFKNYALNPEWSTRNSARRLPADHRQFLSRPYATYFTAFTRTLSIATPQLCFGLTSLQVPNASCVNSNLNLRGASFHSR